jgi:hypothetical protein
VPKSNASLIDQCRAIHRASAEFLATSNAARMMSVVGNERLHKTAQAVNEKLQLVIEAI